MPFRLQPRDVKIPKCDPFKNDLLDRQEQVEIFARLMRNIEGPCVLALDAGWGYGKTTFLNMLAEYLRKQEVPVVKFNAWETDYTDRPLAAIASELHETLKKMCPSVADQLKETASNLARILIPRLIRTATEIVPGAGPLGGLVAGMVEDSLQCHKEADDAVKAFRSTLDYTTENLSKSNKLPLVILIDELDRCRPSYAIELLEVAKHLFSVEHVVFMLAVNRRQLENSVSTLYGKDLDAVDYLRRFIDVDLRLADPDRNKFIDARLTAAGIEQNKDTVYDRLWDLLKTFLGARCLSIRTVDQTIHRYTLVSAALTQGSANQVWGAVLALLLRTFNADLYRRFASLEINDDQLVEEFFEPTELRSLRGTDAAHLFEALVMHAYRELHYFGENGEIRQSLSHDLQERAKIYKAGSGGKSARESPLSKKYTEISNTDSGYQMLRECKILDRDRDLYDDILSNPRLIGYWHAMKCLDSLSPEFLKQTQPS